MTINISIHLKYIFNNNTSIYTHIHNKLKNVYKC
jgi:hypothetical protein